MNFTSPKSAAPRKAKRAVYSTALALLLLAGCSGGEGAQKGAVGDEGGDAAAAQAETSTRFAASDWPVDEVAAEIGPSVVQVNVEAVQRTPVGPREGRGLGSGVIYREDGYIITNNHVVQDADAVNIAFADGTEEKGEVVGTDPSTDLAVVRVDREDLPAAKFVEDLSLRPGDLAVAVGSPSGFQSTVTAGVVSGLDREVPAEVVGNAEAARALVDLIQTDAAISPGNSGGALADEDGEVVGINVAYLPPQQTGAVDIGFAIPSPTAISVANQIIESGRATHPYLGVSLSDLTPEAAERFGFSVEDGALVANVDPDGPAQDAGVRRGSVITAVGSEEVQTTGDLLVALRGYTPGDQVVLTVAEAGQEREVTVELEERE